MVNTDKLKIEYVDMGSVHPNDYNPNEMSETETAKTRISLLTHGFVLPIVVRDTEDGLEIVDGEQRWSQFDNMAVYPENMTGREQELLEENPKLADLLVNQLIPVLNYGDVTRDEAQELTITLNELKGKPNPVKLAKVIEELKNKVGMERVVERLPQTQEQLKNLLGMMQWKKDQYKDTGDPTPPPNDKKDEWVTVEMTYPVAVQAIIESEFDRIGDLLGYSDPEKTAVQRGLILEKICVLSADTPTESLE